MASTPSPAIPGMLLLGAGGLLLVSGWSKRSLSDTWNGVPPAPGGAGPSVSPGTGATGSGVDGLVSVPGHADLSTLFTEMDRMASLHKPYLWGGGHGGYTASGPWDCSGAVSQALHTAGMLKGGPRVSGGFMLWGAGGRGKYFTVYANPTHVFIVIEFGPHKGTAWGTTRSAPGGGVGWHHHSTVGFVARHYPGA